jgi:hypothetical protein
VGKGTDPAGDKWCVQAEGAKKNSQKLKEQSGNVYENKGPVWKTRGDTQSPQRGQPCEGQIVCWRRRRKKNSQKLKEQSRNVYENKGNNIFG